MATFNLYHGSGAFDWEYAFFGDRQGDGPGLFDGMTQPTVDEGQGTNYSQVHLTTDVLQFDGNGLPISTSVTLVVLGSGIDVDVDGHITGGTITEIDLVDNDASTTVLALTGINVNATALASLIADGVTDFDLGGRSDLFRAVFAAEATDFVGYDPDGNHTFFGSSDSDTFDLSASGGGFNYVWSGGGDDTVTGGDGEDFYDHNLMETTDGAGLTINFAAGTIVENSGPTAAGHFDSSVEDIGGSADADTFNGDSRNNVEYGNNGADTLNGNDGDDYLDGGKGYDHFNGGDGYDQASYAFEDSTATKGVIINVSGRTIDSAGNGLPDYFQSDDNASFVNVAAGRIFTLNDHQGLDTNGDIDSYNSIEGYVGSQNSDMLIGGDDDDHLTGAGGGDSLYGGNGNDELRGDDYGNGGDDYISGGDGHDELKGGNGSDTLDGGDGEDHVYYGLETPFTGDDSGHHGIIANLSGNNLTGLATDIFANDPNPSDNPDTVLAHTVIDTTYDTNPLDMHLDIDTILNVEDLEATEYNDYIRGSDSTDYRENLDGHAGDDTIISGDGDDNVRAGAGDDSVDAGDGNDYIVGSSATVTDGSHGDTVDGGNGYDELSFRDTDTWGSDGAFYFSFDGADGSGLVDGLTAQIHDQDWDNDLGLRSVETHFSHIEQVDGSNSDDTFTASGSFGVTDEGSGGPDNAKYIVVSGDGGDDSFQDFIAAVAGTSTSGGSFRIEYGGEAWAHQDYDGHLWGSQGEHGVLVNLSDASSLTLTADDGYSRTLAAFTARDTFDDTDSFSNNQSLTGADERAFNLTDAADVLVAGSLAVNVFGGGGNDKLTGGVGAHASPSDFDNVRGDNLNGGAGNDTIIGNGGNDYIQGGRGDDSLNGGAHLYDGDENVLSYQENRDDNDYGPSGVDVIWMQDSTINAGTARDNWGDTDHFDDFEHVEGSDQRDLFVGNAGSQNVRGGFGIDIFTDSTHNDGDTYSYEDEFWRFKDLHNGDEPTQGVFVDLEYFKDQDLDGNHDIYGKGVDGYEGSSVQTDIFINIENVTGGHLNDNITGSSDNNWLEGREGNDTLNGDTGNDHLDGQDGSDLLIGGIGNDELWGGNDNDTIKGGAGKDTIDGGNGNGDTADYSDKTTAVTVTLNGGSQVSVYVGGTKTANIEDKIQSIENLIGGSGKDKFTGDGNDNVLAGGLGNDTLKGAAGADSFVFNTKLGSSNVDTISDFSHSQHDTIDLSHSIFTKISGQLTASSNAQFYAHSGAKAGHDSSDRIIYDTKTGKLYYDDDGNKAHGHAAVEIAVITGHPTLAASDFHII